MGNDRGPQPTLRGPRVRLRPWRPDDAPAVHAACQDPEIQRWTQVPVPYEREHAEGFVDGIATSTWADGGALFAVEAVDGGPLAGSIGLFPPRDGFTEAGYWTAAGFRGRGFTAEALAVLTAWAFDDVGLHRVELHVEPENTGSRRVAERAGSPPRASSGSGSCTADAPGTSSCTPGWHPTRGRRRRNRPGDRGPPGGATG